jgi:eukaryotic-like serine/threonine-protein kinase
MSEEISKFLEDTYKFRIVRTIAEGGMGTIFEARQFGAEGFEKTMVVKTILEEYSTDPEFREMFIGEAKLVADLVHQNIVQIYQLGKVGTQYYITMEYIDGIKLEHFVDRHFDMGKKIPVNMAAFIVSRVCRGLEYAHQKTDKAGKPLGVVHRDVSPKNIMVAWEGDVKITDFGIAKAAHYFRNREGEVLMGKIQYMSPEQAAYKETDRRSDVFSLGIVMWELLSGRPLFADADTSITLDNVIRMPVPPIEKVNPDVPPDLAAILNKSLERDLAKRYKDAGAMGYDLEYFMYHGGYGPTIVTLAKYLRQLFPESVRKGTDAKEESREFNPDTIIIKDTDLLP